MSRTASNKVAIDEDTRHRPSTRHTQHDVLWRISIIYTLKEREKGRVWKREGGSEREGEGGRDREGERESAREREGARERAR